MVAINEVELASELAYNATVDELVIYEEIYETEEYLFEENEDGELVYKEGVQNVFDRYYDYYYGLIFKCSEKYK